MRREDDDTIKGLVRIAKITWIVFWTLLLAKYYRDASGSPMIAIEGGIANSLMLYVAGFPLSLLVGLAFGVLMGNFTGDPLHANFVVLIAMVIAGYVQWFKIAPRVWRVFRDGKELKL